MHIELTDNARRVLEKRILARDLQGRLIETPEEMFHRVARNIAAADFKHGTPAGSAAIEGAFLEVMTRLEELEIAPLRTN